MARLTDFHRQQVPAVPALHQAGPGYLLTSISRRGLFSFRAEGSSRSRVLHGMGTGGACFTPSRARVPSHVDIPSRVALVSSQGLVPLEGFAWHGYPRRLLYIKQGPGTFSRRYPIEGCPCLEPGVRPARGFSLLGKGPDHLMPRSRGRGFCSAGTSF
jgi:hypothetical protein